MAETEAKERPAPPDPLGADERAYFDSRGEKDIPAEVSKDVPKEDTSAPEPAVQAPPPKPSEPKAELQQTVPQGALHEERKRRQDAEERAHQMELLNARLEERFRAFRDALTPRQQAPQPPPDANRDIFGAVSHLQNEQRTTRAEIEGYKRQIAQEDQLKQLRQWGADAETAYVRQNPDYYQALAHLRNSRARELEVWGMSPSAIGQQLQHEENQLLARAATERRNPAQMAHELARQRGYQKAAPAPAQGTQRQEIDLNRIEAGQRQSASLSNVGGGSGRDVGDVEIEDLLKMNDAEFGTFIQKYPARFRRLKGAAH